MTEHQYIRQAIEKIIDNTGYNIPIKSRETITDSVIEIITRTIKYEALKE